MEKEVNIFRFCFSFFFSNNHGNGNTVEPVLSGHPRGMAERPLLK